MLARTFVFVAALAALLAPSAQAGCTTSTVAGGNSQVDEYTETVPGACGHQNTSPTGNGSDRGGGAGDSAPPAPAAAIQQLQSEGPDGAGAAALVGDDVAGGPGGGDHGSGGPDQSSSGHGPDAAAGNGSVFSGLARSVAGSDDSGGLGILLPIVLGGSLLVALAYLLRRRVRTPQT